VGVRKNVAALSAAELSSFRQGLRKVMDLNDDRGFQNHAGIHGLPLPIWCHHGDSLFLPWHRAYLYLFEKAIQDQQPNTALPWWDWSSTQSHSIGLPQAYTESTTGTPNPLLGSDIRTLSSTDVRNLNRNAPGALAGTVTKPRTVRDPDTPDELPRATTIRSIINNTRTYLDFSSAIENVHNAVHVWVGGTMSVVPVAAYDPIFWAHHAMIDRLWYLWQLRHPGVRPPAQILNTALAPFPLTVSQVLDLAPLGYEYAQQTV
jgi:tyrosinase